MTMFLKPARPGLLVRDPITMEPLPEAGADKPRNTYWTRQMRDGSVITADAKPSAQTDASASPADAAPSKSSKKEG